MKYTILTLSIILLGCTEPKDKTNEFLNNHPSESKRFFHKGDILTLFNRAKAADYEILGVENYPILKIAPVKRKADSAFINMGAYSEFFKLRKND